MKQFVWLYPAFPPGAEPLTPEVGGAAHAFEETVVLVRKAKDPTEEHPHPVGHATGRSTAHAIKAACGLEREAWPNPIVAPADHPHCAKCEALVNPAPAPPPLT